MEKRELRTHTLKTARIVFNDGRSVIDCVVRNLSSRGAKGKGQYPTSPVRAANGAVPVLDTMISKRQPPPASVQFTTSGGRSVGAARWHDRGIAAHQNMCGRGNRNGHCDSRPGIGAGRSSERRP